MAQANTFNQFGTLLRATRNGFFYSNSLQTYVRMRYADREKELVDIELCPSHEIMDVTNRSRKIRPSFIDWRGNGAKKEEIISSIDWPQTDVSRYRQMTFNLDGKLVRGAN